jgi:hypothetical protein
MIAARSSAALPQELLTLARVSAAPPLASSHGGHTTAQLTQLPGDLRPRQPAAQRRRMRHPVVGSKPPQPFPRPPANELTIRDQPTQATIPLHPSSLTHQPTHQHR